MAISLAVGLAFAVLSVKQVSLSPPGVKPRQTQIATAATHILVDAPQSLAGNPYGFAVGFPALVKGATLYGGLISTPPVLGAIGKRAGLAPDRIAAITRLTDGLQRIMREPDLEQRANQIRISKEPYRLDIEPDPAWPVINIYAQAPTVPGAEALADATVAGLRDYLSAQAVRQGRDPRTQVSLIQLGRARGAVANGRVPTEIVALTFLVAFSLSLALLLGAREVRRGWILAGRTAGPAEEEVTEEPLSDVGGPAAGHGALQRSGSGVPRTGMHRRRDMHPAARSLARVGGDWPHTTRVMPWLVAAFLVLLWLVPFNVIQLSVSLPFDLKLDRLVLPLLLGVWVLSLATGGPAAPRVRLTLVHVAIGLFVAVACLGVVLDAHYLNQTLEFDLPVKQLSLVLAYALFFLIVASSVRATEVPAFMRFTLWLAVICAIGTIIEYRFLYDVFYDLSHRLLPSTFTVGTIDPAQLDETGRRMTSGPAEHPLEAVGMLSMAFPIALVGIIHSKERRGRVVYSIAAILLLAAMISTYRKSALLAPVSIVLTIAYFRRRELLKLAPLGVLSLGVVHALSPGALGSVILQLHPSQLGASTVSDRTSDYDAVRPDVWTHLLFGRGFGSYDHLSYRVLDSEILGRLVDTGILGLIAFVLMPVLIVVAARAPIRSRDPVWAPPALAVAAAAVAFLVLAFLFDVTSFPHTPYILMSLAALLAIVVSRDARADVPVLKSPGRPRIRGTVPAVRRGPVEHPSAVAGPVAHRP